MHRGTYIQLSTDILTLMIDGLIESDNFSIKDYFHSNWKNSITHAHVLLIHVKDEPSEHDVVISLDESYVCLLRLIKFTSIRDLFIIFY